ncbi:MAG: pyruvate formate lyase family protein [Promethearchaeota archaeon]
MVIATESNSKGKIEIRSKSSPKLNIFKIQRTCVYDGPGIRTTVFFQGCNLRCRWCQNPEGQSFKGIDNKKYSIDEILEIVLRDKKYYIATNGGITLSGGEPFLQQPESLMYFIKRLKDEGLTVVAETSLHAPWENISKVAPYIDLFYVDLKVVGDEELHKNLTKQGTSLIYSNLEKLLEMKANIKFRMVIVPGLNDSENNIKAAAEFLKSINYNSIELLKYHNLYEEKAKKLGLIQESLNISYEQSVEALKKALKLFRNMGIKAENTDLDTKREKAQFTERVKKIQDDIRENDRSLCIESALLKTKYYRKNGFKKPVYIHRAESLAYILKNKTIKIYPQELLVGNFTSKRMAGQLWPEYYGTLYILILYRINRQKPYPFKISLKDRLKFYFKIFPFWLNHNIINITHPNIFDYLINLSRNAEIKVGFNNNWAAIAHFIVNFERILKLGTTGIKNEIRKIQRENPQNNQNFYEATLIALEGLEIFAQRYSEHLAKLAEKEKDPTRKKELEELSKICAHVPKYPARTFHEALQSMLFLQIALCHESYENAISFGRLDQILYPYYKKDLEKGRITYEKAKELLCLFVLKMEELILVNDGDSFLNLSNLFETVSTDQAVTFGGVDKDGNDATNDVTYMLLDACELQTVSIDFSARIHKDSPQKYMERIARGYLKGSPIPQLHSDDIYIKALLKHYDTTLENARNYSIVGCVEPVASDDHFGNTDCANINVCMPFLQALKGQNYDLWNHGFFDHITRFLLHYIKFIFKNQRFRIARFVNRICNKIIDLLDIKLGVYKYNPVKNMDQLLDRFQEKLNKVAKLVLSEHQNIERSLRTYFPTPLTSSLFKGCLKRGKDVYEGGCDFNSSGIQPVGITDVADSLFAINEVVFKKKLYTINEVINAIDNNFKGEKYKKIRKALLSVPKFGDDSSPEASQWVNKVLEIYNNALDSVPNVPRNGRYSAGYYALNLCNRYGKNTPALPSGRKAGVPLANSITPHYGMPQADLLSALNAISWVDFAERSENGTTATLHIDSSLFQGQEGVKNLAAIFKTYLTSGGMQLQPNVINREILLEAYHNPEKHKYLLVRIAGYCEYFHALSDEMKRIIINRTCYV